MAATSIQWTDHSINPIRFGKGHFCQKVSPGCANCYASRLQPRFGNPQFKGTGGAVPMVVSEQREGAIWFDESKLHEVLRRKKPTRYFWLDMSDLFGSWVPDEWIDRCFAAMALTPQHTHQVLTKRPERMLAYMTKEFGECDRSAKWYNAAHDYRGGDTFFMPQIPIPNVWLGVSVEDQQRADERIPLLLQCPAAVRFLSCEPLLGPVNLEPFLQYPPLHENYKMTLGAQEWRGVDWVIIGGESGPGARPMDLAWARSLVEQCREAIGAC